MLSANHSAVINPGHRPYRPLSHHYEPDWSSGVIAKPDGQQLHSLCIWPRQQALVVDQQHRLYPACVDEKFIPAARVEAVLRRNQQLPEETPGETLTPFYIELEQDDEK